MSQHSDNKKQALIKGCLGLPLFFSRHKIFKSKNYPKFASEDRGYQIAKVDSCKLTVVFLKNIACDKIDV